MCTTKQDVLKNNEQLQIDLISLCKGEGNHSDRVCRVIS